MNRSKFFKTTALGGFGSTFLMNSSIFNTPTNGISYSDLDEILSKPVLKKEYFTDPVIIEKMELLKYNDSVLCRAVSSDGVEGYSAYNDLYTSLYGVFLKRVQPLFVGKNAVELEQILEDVWFNSYKMQGLALYLPTSAAELAVLDMLGKVADRSMGELLGEVQRSRIHMYFSNNNRGISAEESVERILERANEFPTMKALKIKIAGRLYHSDEPAGRTEKKIRLVREAFGDEMTLYADANSGYSIDDAIRVGRIMEDYKYSIFEEPVRFDWYEGTKKVADALDIPIGGGEQEPSMMNFKWMLNNDALQVYQPDQFYFGMINSVKVARMAEAAGKLCAPHMSGTGLGYLYMMHFVSILPNTPRYNQFKGFNEDLPMECPTSDLTIDNEGALKVPTGPGLGVIIDPDFIKKHEIITSMAV